MKQVSKEIAELEGEIYLLSKLPLEERSTKLSEIIKRLRRIVHTFDQRRKLHFDSVRRCLIVLDKLLDSGTVSITNMESSEVYSWARTEIRKILKTWHD